MKNYNLKKVLLNYKYHILFICICSFIIIGSTSFIPYYLGLCFKEIETQSRIKDFYPLSLLIIIYMLRAIFKLIRNHIAASMGNNVVMDLRLLEIQNLIQKYPFRNNKEEKINTYSILTYDLNALAEIISWRTFVFFEDLMILIISFYNMLVISPFVVLCLVPCLIILFYTSMEYGKKVGFSVSILKGIIANISTVVFENIIGQKLIRVLNAQKAENIKFNELNKENLEYSISLNSINRCYLPFMEFMGYLTMLLSVVLTSYLALVNKVNISVVVIFNGYMWILIGIISNLSDIILFYVNSRESLKRVSEYLVYKGKEAGEGKYEIKGEINSINLRNVSFKINGTMVLNNISTQFKKGTITTITGAIGSGKTTMLEIISGLNLSYDGMVEINKTSLQEIDSGLYRKRIGYVPQEPFFFNGSIRENIVLGRQEISETDIAETLFRCRLDEVINKLEFKLDTVINKDTNFLSGGEKQRINLARALIGHPDVLLIDDSITAIDFENQIHILDSIQEIKQNMIIIFASNLKNVIDISDKVYRLTDGCFQPA